jgi:hydroxymethylpyrimidine pyrophosphatase-like HAD family hydrolase
MYKIIACDLDETLLSDDRSISKENIEAIQKAKELGVKFVPATGRGYNTVDGTLKELGLYDLENEYVISYNGGAISENKGSKLLYFEGITFEKASELYKRGLNYDVCIHVYTKDMVYALVIFNVEPNTFHTFFDAIYWATISLTTVGYGDIYPVTTLGRMITMVSSFMGIPIVALPAGIITAGYMKEIGSV